jgi:hypothetical protein
MPNLDPVVRLARQKRTATILAVVLLLGGLAVLFFVRRIPLPLRLLVGLGDIVAGCVLLLLIRQKLGAPPPS